MMKITFIRPSMTAGVFGDALEPLAFGILAGLTPPDVALRLYDERIEPLNMDEPTDLVAISTDTYSARRAYQVAAQYRRRGIPVVIGGYHPTLWTDEALGYADVVVVGDAEDTWPAVVEDFRHGTLQCVYRSQFPALADLWVERSIFAGKRYGSLRLVQFGRGCRQGCDFCSIHAFYGNRIRYRPVPDVILEIKDLNARGIIFTDDNFFAERTVAVELLNQLKPLRIRWACQASLEVASDDALLRLMAESGCVSVTVGLESLQDGNLAQMRKPRHQTSERYAELIRRFHEQGIMVYGSFVFGYDGDTPEAFRHSLDFTVRNKLFLANFNPLMPMPGTPLYARLRGEGRLLYDPWWLDPAYRYGMAALLPREMSAEELTAGCYWARTQFNRITCIARRGMNWKANARNLYNAGLFLAANWINRREIHRKQGLPLGAPGAFEPAEGSVAR